MLYTVLFTVTCVKLLFYWCLTHCKHPHSDTLLSAATILLSAAPVPTACFLMFVLLVATGYLHMHSVLQ